MKWKCRVNGEVEFAKKFCIIPRYKDGVATWLEYIYVRRVWVGNPVFGYWCDMEDVSKEEYEAQNKQ